MNFLEKFRLDYKAGYGSWSLLKDPKHFMDLSFGFALVSIPRPKGSTNYQIQPSPCIAQSREQERHPAMPLFILYTPPFKETFDLNWRNPHHNSMPHIL